MKLSKKFDLIVFFLYSKFLLICGKKNISFQKQCALILSILPIAFGNILLPLFDFRSAPGFNTSPCMGEWVFRAWMGEFSVHEFFTIVIIIIIDNMNIVQSIFKIKSLQKSTFNCKCTNVASKWKVYLQTYFNLSRREFLNLRKYANLYSASWITDARTCNTPQCFYPISQDKWKVKSKIIVG